MGNRQWATSDRWSGTGRGKCLEWFVLPHAPLAPHACRGVSTAGTVAPSARCARASPIGMGEAGGGFSLLYASAPPPIPMGGGWGVGNDASTSTRTTHDQRYGACGRLPVAGCRLRRAKRARLGPGTKPRPRRGRGPACGGGPTSVCSARRAEVGPGKGEDRETCRHRLGAAARGPACGSPGPGGPAWSCHCAPMGRAATPEWPLSCRPPPGSCQYCRSLSDHLLSLVTAVCHETARGGQQFGPFPF